MKALNLQEADNGFLLQLNIPAAEDEIAMCIDSAKKQRWYRSLLLELLAEDYPAFQGKSGNAVTRMRGYALAAMEMTGTPTEAFPYIIDVLENERNAYLIGGACKALRGAKKPFDGAAESLLTAFDHIRLKDDALTYECYKPQWPLTTYTTALQEILATIRWYGPSAVKITNGLTNLLINNFDILLPTVIEDIKSTIAKLQTFDKTSCCTIGINSNQTEHRVPYRRNLAVTVEDQDRGIFQLDTYLKGHFTIIAFFYTRCDNPFKCSMTVACLAQLTQECKNLFPDRSLHVLGITYDSAYDTPAQLKIYGEQRGFIFSADNHLVRVPDEFEIVKRYFRIGASFIGSIVNNHRIEVYLTDENGKIFETITRRQWQSSDIVAAINLHLKKNRSFTTRCYKILFQRVNDILQTVGSSIFPLFIAFFPKCPLCWAAYMSAMGISGLPFLSYSKKWCFLFALMAIINYTVLTFRAKRTGRYLPLAINTIGIIFTLVLFGYLKYHWAIYPGLACMLAGSAMSNTGLHLPEFKFARTLKNIWKTNRKPSTE